MKEKSYMVIIPENQDDISPDKLKERLNSDNCINVLEYDEKTICYKIGIGQREYIVRFALTPIEIPSYFRSVHLFTDLDFQKINSIKLGISVEMEYTDSFLDSYHDQLRIINCIMPDKLAVIDIPSEKLLSGKWVKLAAESEIPPAPKYLFTVQAVSDGSNEVWLHTHGLKRCGLSELEILCSNKEMCSSHYYIIETIAVRMIENEMALEPYEPMFLAWLTDKVAMVATIVDWRKGLEFYPDAEIGKADDRDDYHAEGTSVIMLYLSPDDRDSKKLSKVQELDEYLGQNTMFMVSTSETARMRKLAQERIDYVRRAAAEKDTNVLLKIGLHMDDEFIDPDRDEQEQREHIWFELKSIKKGLFNNKEVFEAELTQDPYYVKGMKKGSIGKFEVSDITDWIIFANKRRYSPDDVYMM